MSIEETWSFSLEEHRDVVKCTIDYGDWKDCKEQALGSVQRSEETGYALKDNSLSTGWI
jgi:hypothetical protein